MSGPIVKPYATLPDDGDIAYIDGKLTVASGIIRRTERPKTRQRWLETVDVLLDQRLALAEIEAAPEPPPLIRPHESAGRQERV